MPPRAPVRFPAWAERLLAVAHVDWDPPTRQPPARRVVLATALAVGASLAADALLVALGTHLFPSTRGFVHFRPMDYGSLTVVGVATACAGWPIVTRVTSAPRWLFLRLALVVSLVLLLPDVWILLRGEPAKAVAVLVAMHVTIALVTYNFLVYLAPAGRRRPAGGTVAASRPGTRRARPGALDAIRTVAEQMGRDTAFPTGDAPFPAGPATAQVIGRPSLVASAAHPPPGPVLQVAGSRRTAADVVRPPTTLAEPRSAVRVLPSLVGARPTQAPSPAAPVDLDGRRGNWADRVPGGRETEEQRRGDPAGRRRRDQRGRHAARP